MHLFFLRNSVVFNLSYGKILQVFYLMFDVMKRFFGSCIMLNAFVLLWKKVVSVPLRRGGSVVDKHQNPICFSAICLYNAENCIFTNYYYRHNILFLPDFWEFHLFFSIFAQLSKSDGNLKDITRQKGLRLHMYNAISGKHRQSHFVRHVYLCVKTFLHNGLLHLRKL